MIETVLTILATPTRNVQPNGRAHYYDKAAAIRELRGAAKYAAVDAINRGIDDAPAFVGRSTPVTLTIDIQWEKGRKTLDHDNAIASCKAIVDGLSDAFWDGRDGHVTIGRVTQHRGTGVTQVTLRAGE